MGWKLSGAKHQSPETPTSAAAPAQATSLRRDRIGALLRGKGIEPNWDAPTVTGLEHIGGRTGVLAGADVNPGNEYVRANANNAATIQRYLERGYAIVDPGKDVRIENCHGPDDVMLAIPRERAEQRRELQKQRRAMRRGTSEAAQGRSTYSSSEGVFKRPAT